jgi:hypothetical protein
MVGFLRRDNRCFVPFKLISMRYMAAFAFLALFLFGYNMMLNLSWVAVVDVAKLQTISLPRHYSSSFCNYTNSNREGREMTESLRAFPNHTRVNIERSIDQCCLPVKAGSCMLTPQEDNNDAYKPKFLQSIISTNKSNSRRFTKNEKRYRCFPSFVIIGSMKSGTGALLEALARYLFLSLSLSLSFFLPCLQMS